MKIPPIFFNNKPIILTTNIDKETNFKNFLLKSVSLETIVNTLSNKQIKAIHLIGENENMLLPLFLKKMPNVIAAGGKVYHTDGRILFIYRNNKWDLPKGKAEAGETIETTAIREVEEETAVKNISIISPLETTYHIFNNNNGKYKLKITHWYNMKTNYNGILTPQLNEGITKVKWLDMEQIEEALHNSYANIQLLFSL